MLGVVPEAAHTDCITQHIDIPQNEHTRLQRLQVQRLDEAHAAIVSILEMHLQQRKLVKTWLIEAAPVEWPTGILGDQSHRYHPCQPVSVEVSPPLAYLECTACSNSSSTVLDWRLHTQSFTSIQYHSLSPSIRNVLLSWPRFHLASSPIRNTDQSPALPPQTSSRSAKAHS